MYTSIYVFHARIRIRIYTYSIRNTQRSTRTLMYAVYVKRSTGHTHTHTTTAEQTTHTNTERATAQRRLLVEVVVADPKLPPSAALLLSSLLPIRGTGHVQELFAMWPLHDIATTNIVWCMAYGRGGGGGGYIAH